ncbi:MAG: peptidoglycan DD-metalloendopeptidase family protein [Pseudomonadota bacterium]|nr:peptidoglycan DD-metalloendopeptidase family protein [Pseudomonadota bacterium]
MTLIQKINNNIKKIQMSWKFYRVQDYKKNLIIWSSFVIFFSLVFFISINLSETKKINDETNLKEVTSSNEFSSFTKYLFSRINSPYVEVDYKIKNNDSIEKILKKFNIEAIDIKKISIKLKEKKLTNIYSGRQLSLIYKKSESGLNSVVNILYPVSNTSSVEIRKLQNDFSIKENILKLYKKEVVVKNKITNNLYSSAINADIEPNIIVEFARIFGFEVDFQRDIRRGDWFEIYYEKFEDDNGKVRDTGKIIYASMFVNNNEINLYNFKHENEEEYYDIKGKSITKSLMKTPINGARLSSSFGMRKHPILGYNKMHRGTDFAAPSGTPIMASGSGTVTRARWCGGGGNCVKIKHNSTYETVYAHMKSFAKGVKEGKKVKQGQIIGYVGSTGMSTGPHLHYEVIVNGKKVNSQRLKLPSGKILKGAAREKFEFERIKIDLKLAQLR